MQESKAMDLQNKSFKPTSFEGKSLVETCNNLFDPTDKIRNDMKFIELLEILKTYPGDLTAYVLEIKTAYENMYNIGLILSTRYQHQQLDILTLKDMNRLLEKQLSATQQSL